MQLEDNIPPETITSLDARESGDGDSDEATVVQEKPSEKMKKSRIPIRQLKARKKTEPTTVLEAPEGFRCTTESDESEADSWCRDQLQDVAENAICDQVDGDIHIKQCCVSRASESDDIQENNQNECEKTLYDCSSGVTSFVNIDMNEHNNNNLNVDDIDCDDLYGQHAEGELSEKQSMDVTTDKYVRFELKQSMDEKKGLKGADDRLIVDGSESNPHGNIPNNFGVDEAIDECAKLNDQTQSSIESGVAQAPGCSRVSTAKGSNALQPPPPPASCPLTTNQPFTDENASKIQPRINDTNNNKKSHLSWGFRNGRLVFDIENESDSKCGHSSRQDEQVVDDNSEESEEIDLVSSKTLNKKDKTRLKCLEEKLKQAGITDGLDDNQNLLDDNEIKEIIPDDTSTICQFDTSTYNQINAKISKMGTDGDVPTKHNPDRDNLKSLLKRPGKAKKPNRVVFNENKNEFFDADYIILIREECDYDEEEDDGVCTCNQHEMVRLTCCEPNCNCNYDGYDQTPQSPKFAPPLEFVDAVTLSPPEGYKDMELEEQQLLALQQMARRGQRGAVCRECSTSHEEHEDEGEGSQSDNEVCGSSDHEEEEEKEKTDQSQQTTPTTPPGEAESITMTTVTEQRNIREIEEERKAPSPSLHPIGSPISGILKGGKLWKQQSQETNSRVPEPQISTSDSGENSDDGSSRRSVRFTDEGKRDICDGAPDNSLEETTKQEERKEVKDITNSASPESTEMMLTFKLGNHVLISNNSLKPNSAVRQLFPCTKPLTGGKDDEIHQYLVTAESLKAFEEAKRAKLPQIIQSGDTDESIKRAIERNTLRRSLIRYEPKLKKNVQKTDNSLVERIKQLTCDVDDVHQEEDIPPRSSPPGEEARNSPEITQIIQNNPKIDKSFSPSSSSTTSSNSSSMSSTYKKITDLFNKREKDSPSTLDIKSTLPDLGNGPLLHETESCHHAVTKVNSATSDSRRQFLSTLAPLTACVSGLGNPDEYYYHINNQSGERTSTASSVGTEYSLEDIDEGLKNGDEDVKRIAPDVIAGTPSASESGDELAMFVQQDAGRIERIKKKYQPDPPQNQQTANSSTNTIKDDDDEHDDYGFNRRPSVRGIKPRFGTTTEILQQIQNQLQPPQPPRVAWPYYSESGLTDNSKQRNMNQVPPQYSAYPPDDKRNFVPQYRPTTLPEENMYQNCMNQRCVREYRVNLNQQVNIGCSEYYQSLPRCRNGRPQSPPPLELSKNYHQTMVYIPYNHIEGYHQPYYHQSNDYVRVSNQNQINKRFIEPIYQQRVVPHPVDDPHYFPQPKPMIRVPFTSHLMSRSESPLPGQFSTARSTQTSTCNYYPRYQRPPSVWQQPPDYVTTQKVNRHSFPNNVRFPSDQISLTDSEGSTVVNFNQQSPTKPRFIERGVPEGAASVSPQDVGTQNTSSTMTSPTSPQTQQPQQKPLFYAMNV